MKALKSFEIDNLVDYTVNRIISKDIKNYKEFREIEKAGIQARLSTIINDKKRNLSKEQVLEVVYKELGVNI